jgi:V/A-type H+-transporting ATPase subunit E
MSVTIEDKIELFSKVIFGNIEAQSSQKRQSLTETHKKELEALAEEAEKRKKELMEAAVAKAEREKTKLIAQANNQQQHTLIELKQQTIQKIMGRLQDLAGAFTEHQDYKDFMKKNIESTMMTLEKSEHITFYCMEKDIELLRQILEERLMHADKLVGHDIKKVAHNIIGGIIAEDTENLLQLDLTLKALIEEHKDTVGAAITRKFNEVSSL